MSLRSRSCLALAALASVALAADTVFPQSMLVDYVRVHQRPAP